MSLNRSDFDWDILALKVILSQPGSGILAQRNSNLLLPYLSSFMAVPNRLLTVQNTSGGTSLRKAFANLPSQNSCLSIFTLEQFAIPLQPLFTRVAKSWNLRSTRSVRTKVSTSVAVINSSS